MHVAALTRGGGLTSASVTLRLVLLLQHASHPDCCPQYLHACVTFSSSRALTCMLLLPCPLLAGTLSSCSDTGTVVAKDTSSHFGCPRKIFALSCMIYTTMQFMQ